MTELAISVVYVTRIRAFYYSIDSLIICVTFDQALGLNTVSLTRICPTAGHAIG